jgi:hypothetical protein
LFEKGFQTEKKIFEKDEISLILEDFKGFRMALHVLGTGLECSSKEPLEVDLQRDRDEGTN